jgi:hypothetical protein
MEVIMLMTGYVIGVLVGRGAGKGGEGSAS